MMVKFISFLHKHDNDETYVSSINLVELTVAMGDTWKNISMQQAALTKNFPSLKMK